MKKESKKLVLTILLSVFFGISLWSQSVIHVTGKVVDDQTGAPLSQVMLNIVPRSQILYSDTAGAFQFYAHLGEEVVFTKELYRSKTVFLNTELLEIRLKMNNQNDSLLSMVKITPGRVATEVMTSEGVSSVQGEVLSVRGNRSEEQVVYIDGIRMRESSSRKEPSARYNSIASSPATEYDDGSNESYRNFEENSFQSVSEQPLSTFSIDVDAASYSNMRRMVNQGKIPPVDAIRTEELINYFRYDYEAPRGETPVKIQTEVAECPWNIEHYLVKIGVKAKEIPSMSLPASNLVFLIDVSGSMYGATRLELVKSSLKLLVNNLRKEDRVAIVVYAGAAGEVLPSTSGSDKQKILEAIHTLTAGGSTAGGAGIQLAYKIAQNNFIENGNNRIILCTDGDFNVGVSSERDLERMIEEKRQTGIFLTILGYGMGNYKDSKMQVLAQKGNGNHAYIDNIQEANRVLINEFGATMYTVAKDVKIQVEFNPEHVAHYRLIGYESRMLNREDFNDDSKDAGELGAGHTVTALYEIVPVDAKSNVGQVDPLKYQQPEIRERAAPTNYSDELMTVKLRYKEVKSNTSEKIEHLVKKADVMKASSEDFNFIISVALFGQLLRQSSFTQNSSFDDVLKYAKLGVGSDENGYRREYIRLVEAVKQIKK